MKHQLQKINKIIFLSLFMLGCLSGCSDNKSNNDISNIQNDITVEEDKITNDLSNEKQVTIEEISESEGNVYKSILMNLLENDGLYDNEIIFENGIDSEKDKFALCDIDSDGDKEIIFACYSGEQECEKIYELNEEGISWVDTFPFPERNKYFENGIIFVYYYGISPLSGEFDEFDIYEYSDGAYLRCGDVTVWRKEVKEEGFPTDIDVNNHGIVYYASTTMTIMDDPISQEEYEQWISNYIGDKKEIDIK